MSKFDSEVAPVAPISRSALVAGGGARGSQPELIRDLRAVAMEAAAIWSRAMAPSNSDPEEFGRKVALAYLAALRELNAGFEPGSECPAGRA